MNKYKCPFPLTKYLLYGLSEEMVPCGAQRPDNLSLIPGSHRVARKQTPELSSHLYMHTVEHMSILRFKCTIKLKFKTSKFCFAWKWSGISVIPILLRQEQRDL